MSEQGYTYGRVVWRSLMTRDVAKARAFYAGLFGWAYEDVESEAGVYTRISLGGKAFGGMWQNAPDSPAPSIWMSYVSVPDVDAVARLAVENGGGVLSGPTDVPNVGRTALIRDFSAALIVAFHALEGDPPPEPPKPGEFCWESLGTPNMAKAKAFYGKLFGWVASKGREGTAGMFTTDGAQRTQIADILENKEFRSAWIPHVRVEKLGPATDRVSELGGDVTAFFAIPHVARIAIIVDPAGAQLCLVESARK